MKHQLHYLWCLLLGVAALPAAAQTADAPKAIEVGETAVPKLGNESGDTWESAIATDEGTVDIPASPSERWFKLVAPEDCMLRISTTMSGGSFFSKNEIDVYVGAVTDENKTVVEPDPGWSSTFSPAKIIVSKGDIIYVCFNNKDNNSEMTTATFAFVQPQPGETPENPIAIDFKMPSMTYPFTVNEDNEPTWYSIDIPENGIFSCNSQEVHFSVYLYSPDNVDEYLAYGDSDWSGNYGLTDFQIEAGKYLLKIVDLSEDVEATISLVADEEDPENPDDPGDEHAPINIENGEAEVPAYSPVDYTFTPTEDGTYDLSTSLKNVTFKITTTEMLGGIIPSTSEITLEELENGKYRFTATASMKYDIVLTKAEGDESATGTLTIEVVDPASIPGATWENPIETVAGDVTIPASPSETWYKIEAPQDGMLCISSTMKGGALISPNTIQVYIGSVAEENLTTISPSGYPSTFPETKIAVKEGDVIYVCVLNQSNNSAETKLTLTFTEPEQPKEGDTADNPIAIDFQLPEISYTFEANDYMSARWYSLQIPENGVFSCTSENPMTVAIYSAENTDEPLAEDDYNMITGFYGLSDLEIEAGSYLLKISGNDEDAEATISLIVDEENPEVEVTLVNIEVTDGQMYGYTVANGTQSSFSLNLPENWSVKTAQLNDEKIEVADKYQIAADGEAQNYLFTVAYDKEIGFIDQTTGMVAISSDLKIGVINGKLVIEGTTGGESIIVYTMGGLQVAACTASGNREEIALPAGSYVVTVAGTAAKILL